MPARRIALIALLVAAAAMPASAAGALRMPADPFSPQSFWNRQLGPDAPLARNSGDLVSRLASQARRHDTWINTKEYSTPVYVVPADQRRVPVHLDTPSAMYAGPEAAAELAADLASVPIPLHARPAAGTDSQIVIWQPSTDTMWELWIAHHAARDGCLWGDRLLGGWHAAWGARIEDVSRHPGRIRAPFGAAASGLPLLGGLIRTSELQNGEIDHALALTIPEVKPGQFAWPATRTDGDSPTPAAIPEGTRFRIDPDLRLEDLGLSPVTLAVARAVQRHGLVISDKGGAVAFEAQDTRSVVDPYRAIFGRRWQSYALEGFPWRRLQALASPRPDRRR